MHERQIIIIRHPKQFLRTRKVYEGLPDPELTHDSSLYLNQNKYFEAIEAKLLKSGLSATDIEEELYQLRHNYNTAEDLFYVRDTDKVLLGQADFDDLTETERLIWDATDHMTRHNYPDASMILDLALGLDDKSILTYANMGVIAYRTRNPTQALFYFNKALSLEPNNVQLLSYKLDCLRGGDLTVFSEFKQVIDKLLELNPYHPVALNYKCQIAFRERDLVAMKIYASRYFENWYMGNLVIAHLNNLLLLMSVDESMSFLSDLSEKLKWEGARKKLQRLKSKYLNKVKDSEDSSNELGSASSIGKESTSNTVSAKGVSFTFEGKV
jgi:tetratricopeptide (TPR) repeat protein